MKSVGGIVFIITQFVYHNLERREIHHIRFHTLHIVNSRQENSLGKRIAVKTVLAITVRTDSEKYTATGIVMTETMQKFQERGFHLRNTHSMLTEKNVGLSLTVGNHEGSLWRKRMLRGVNNISTKRKDKDIGCKKSVAQSGKSFTDHTDAFLTGRSTETRICQPTTPLLHSIVEKEGQLSTI